MLWVVIVVNLVTLIVALILIQNVTVIPALVLQ